MSKNRRTPWHLRLATALALIFAALLVVHLGRSKAEDRHGLPDDRGSKAPALDGGGTPLDPVTEPSGNLSIFLQVLDAEGAPAGKSSFLIRAGAREFRGSTGADGRARLGPREKNDDLRDALVFVASVDPAQGILWTVDRCTATDALEGSIIEVRFSPGSRIDVLAQSLDGAPQENVALPILVTTLPGCDPEEARVFRQLVSHPVELLPRTGADGRAAIPRVSEGLALALRSRPLSEFSVRFETTLPPIRASTLYQASPPGIYEVRYQVSRTPIVPLRILLSDGTPAVGALVGWRYQRPSDPADVLHYCTRADAEGVARLRMYLLGDDTAEDLEGSQCRVLCRHESGQWGRVEMTLSSQPSEAELRLLPVSDFVELRGRVLGAGDQTPVEGLDVSLSCKEFDDSILSTVKTDAGGRFSFQVPASEASREEVKFCARFRIQDVADSLGLAENNDLEGDLSVGIRLIPGVEVMIRLK
jgi:hypothetical protein